LLGARNVTHVTHEHITIATFKTLPMIFRPPAL
jgi:hypothetical protein